MIDHVVLKKSPNTFFWPLLHMLRVDVLLIGCACSHGDRIYDVRLNSPLDLDLRETVDVKCKKPSDTWVIDLSFLQPLRLHNYDPAHRQDCIILSYQEGSASSTLATHGGSGKFVLLNPIDDHGILRHGTYCFSICSSQIELSAETRVLIKRLETILSDILMQLHSHEASTLDAGPLQHKISIIAQHFRRLGVDFCIVSFRNESEPESLVTPKTSLERLINEIPTKVKPARNWALVSPDTLCIVSIPLPVSIKQSLHSSIIKTTSASEQRATPSSSSEAGSRLTTHEAYCPPVSKRSQALLKRPFASSAVSIASMSRKESNTSGSALLGQPERKLQRTLSPRRLAPLPSARLDGVTKGMLARRLMTDFTPAFMQQAAGSSTDLGSLSSTTVASIQSPHLSPSMIKLLKNRGMNATRSLKEESVLDRPRFSSAQWVKRKLYTRLEIDHVAGKTTMPENHFDNTRALNKWRTTLRDASILCSICGKRYKTSIQNIKHKRNHDISQVRAMLTARLNSDPADIHGARDQLLTDLCHASIGDEAMQILLCDLFLFDNRQAPLLLALAKSHNLLTTRNCLLGALHLASLKDYAAPEVNNFLTSSFLAAVKDWEMRRSLSFFLAQSLPSVESVSAPPTSRPSAKTQVPPKRKPTGYQELLKLIICSLTREAVLALLRQPIQDCHLQDQDENVGIPMYQGSEAQQILKFLISLFWNIKAEIIRMKPAVSGAESESVVTWAKVLLQEMIDVVDDIENKHTAKISFLKIFANQLSFKAYLTSLNDQFTSGVVSENADRRTERIRRTIARESTAASKSLTELLRPRPTQLDATSPTNKAASPTPTPPTVADATVKSAFLTGYKSVANLFFFGNEEAIRHQAVKQQEEELYVYLMSKASVTNADCCPRICSDKVPTLFPLPTDPDLLVVNLDPVESYVIKSTKYPLVMTCNVIDVSGKAHKKKFLYKSNDDLRQDQFIIEVFRWFQLNVFEAYYAMDTYLSRYQVLPLSCHEGLIEFVEGATPISHLKRQNELSLKTYIEQDTSCAAENMRRFIISSGCYSAMTYICSVGDRHQDNLMVDRDGRFFHIDYGYIFGSDPKFGFASIPMKITNEMISCMNGSRYSWFIQTCCLTFYIIRKAAMELTLLMQFVYSSEMPDIKRLRKLAASQKTPASYADNANGGSSSLIESDRLTRQQLSSTSSNALSTASLSTEQSFLEAMSLRSKTLQTLRLELDDTECVAYLINDVLGNSVRSILPVVADKLHEWAIYWK
eukprot:Blabericola_migrator_1__10843@NODE_623_length_7209_cov_181_617194_g454_i0_p1_GENE_NODE_623_length_7209_cov_181_617194_g454_i0NODE_623_length_7209_cov_181_617194_g454_i0_p1_ORF_typecomplete_len1258_score161_44PI3_PI4_kinase/PF00454_27/1_8e35DUF4135/PF13575_6/0_00026RtcR/PF06956_11/0_24ROS_MUCR/PF05443_11/0_51_NODE_623_length_7209_cov_181_617194_g454_i022235996